MSLTILTCLVELEYAIDITSVGWRYKDNVSYSQIVLSVFMITES